MALGEIRAILIWASYGQAAVALNERTSSHLKKQVLFVERMWILIIEPRAETGLSRDVGIDF